MYVRYGKVHGYVREGGGGGREEGRDKKRNEKVTEEDEYETR